MKKGRNSGEKGSEDPLLWQRVTRTVKPYDSPPKELPALKKMVAKPAVKSKASPSSSVKKFDGPKAVKLKRGDLQLEGRLDLHGMTQAEAFSALHRFILKAVEHGKRTVLVITGKGLRSEGVLRRLLPLWLEDQALGRHVISVTVASPKDGGSGAFYLRLRKS